MAEKRTPKQKQIAASITIGLVFILIGVVLLLIEPTRIASFAFFVLGLVFIGQGQMERARWRNKK